MGLKEFLVEGILGPPDEIHHFDPVPGVPGLAVEMLPDGSFLLTEADVRRIQLKNRGVIKPVLVERREGGTIIGRLNTQRKNL